MTDKNGGCFSKLRCLHDSNDSSNGYSSLDHKEVSQVNLTPVKESNSESDSNDYFEPSDSYQRQPAIASQNAKKNRRRTKGGTKQQSKQIRKQLGQALHSTWKWCKRGAVTVIPHITPFGVVYPFNTTFQQTAVTI